MSRFIAAQHNNSLLLRHIIRGHRHNHGLSTAITGTYLKDCLCSRPQLLMRLFCALPTDRNALIHYRGRKVLGSLNCASQSKTNSSDSMTVPPPQKVGQAYLPSSERHPGKAIENVSKEFEAPKPDGQGSDEYVPHQCLSRNRKGSSASISGLHPIEKDILDLVVSLASGSADQSITVNRAMQKLDKKQSEFLSSEFQDQLFALIEAKGRYKDLYMLSTEFIGWGPGAETVRHGAPSKHHPIQAGSFRYCEICSTEVPNTNWYNHIYGRRHSGMVFQARRQVGQEWIGEPPPHYKPRAHHVWCKWCEMEVALVGDDFYQHANSTRHERNRWKDRKKSLLGQPSTPAVAPTKTKKGVQKRGLNIG